MAPSNAMPDWPTWFERWERMQDCYVPQRRRRFDLVFQFAKLASQDDVHVLDLGCGPGSLAFYAFRYYPRASVVAVGLDPVLLEVGRHVTEGMSKEVQFLCEDLRQADWWKAFDSGFDLVVSATALHWLSRSSLRELFGRVFRVLKPGGWFMNSDHVASDDAGLQQRYRELLAAEQKAAFSAAGADDWDGFWTELKRVLGDSELLAAREAAGHWEGTDDGHPRGFHISELRKCGFVSVDVIWQDLGEAIIGARKPI